MKKILIIILFVSLVSCERGQVEKTFFNDCFSQDKALLMNQMVYSFENRICHYYNISKENSDEAFVKYIEDFASRSEDLRSITTKKELSLLDKSNNNLKDDIWITFKEKIESVDLGDSLEDEIMIVTREGTTDNKNERKYENLFTVNYNGKFAECLTKNSKEEDFKQMVFALKDAGDISPLLVAYGLKEFDENSFNEYTMKSFIAFELYYAILNMIPEN